MRLLKQKKIAAKLGFDPKIIKIKDKYTSGNLQNWARIKRRDILYHVAQKHSADIVLGINMMIKLKQFT